MKWHVITSATFYSLEANYQVQPTVKGTGMRLHLSKGGVSKNLWRYFKTTVGIKFQGRQLNEKETFTCVHVNMRTLISYLCFGARIVDGEKGYPYRGIYDLQEAWTWVCNLYH